MMCSSAAHFVVDSVESTINRKINGNILVKGFVNSVQSSAVETVASAVCHQIGKSYPQMERTLIDEINHKLLHGVTAASASVLMGNPDGAMASAGAAMVAETVVDGLDAINRQTQQNMTHQERQAIQQMEAKKALDQKTNKSLFNFTIRNRDIASLITAFMLAFTTPDHLVAEAYQASQRALDWNHDTSSIKAKLTEIEEEEVKEIPHEHEDGLITLECTPKEYDGYNQKYQRWKARDEAYQRELDESNGTKKTFVETKRTWNRLYHRPSTPPRKLGGWSDGKVKEGLQKGVSRVSKVSSQLRQSHVQDLQSLKENPFDAANLLKAPATLTNEVLGQGLHLMGEIVTPVFDKVGSVARQILRANGVSPQVASDVVYGMEGATLLYGGVKSVTSLTKASRLGRVSQSTQLRTMEALGLEVPYVPPHNMTHGVSKNFSSLQKNIEGTRLERLSRQEGLSKLKSIPERQVLELSHNVGSRQAFDRKMTALQDLADRGKLMKTKSVRDESVTIKYRKGLLDRAKQDWKATDPDKFQRFKDVMDRMDADHLHELQLKGIDHSSMLSMLDKQVNRSVGSQIRHQLSKMPEGTPITTVIEKGAK